MIPVLTLDVVDTKSQVVFRNVTGTGKPQWISLHYTVNNATGKTFFFLDLGYSNRDINSLHYSWRGTYLRQRSARINQHLGNELSCWRA